MHKSPSIKVYHLFFLISFLILLQGVLTYTPQDMYDINVHDTYYVARKLDYVALFSLVYFLDAIGYWLFLKKLGRKLVSALTWFHGSIWIGGFFGFWTHEYFGYQNPIFDDSDYKLRFVLIFGLAIVAHPVFLLNLIIGSFRRRNPAMV